MSEERAEGTGGEPTKPLPEVYREWIAATIDEKGVGLSHGMIVDADGGMTLYALDLTPPQAYAMMLGEWTKRRPAEMIFALDRFTKPGQGTTLGDLVAGFYCPSQSAAPRPFILEYQHEPRIVKPIEWDNLFWNAALHSEIIAALRGRLGLDKRA